MKKKLDSHFYELQEEFRKKDKAGNITAKELREYHKEFVKYGREWGFCFIDRYPKFPSIVSLAVSLFALIISILARARC